MKRRWWGVAAFVFATLLALPASAIDTVPSSPNKVTGPLLITGYSFSGASLRYVQIYNNSASLVVLDGWKVVSATKTVPVAATTYTTLNGMLEPGDHVFAAIPGLIDRSSFELPEVVPGLASLIGTVSLTAPSASNYNDETATVPAITTSTVKEIDAGMTNYYLRRDVSSSTGNYLSGFTFILPVDPLKNDKLYTIPAEPAVRIVEVYPDAATCPPFGSTVICTDYVKLHNKGPVSIDLSAYRLRTGVYGQASTASNTKILHGEVPGGRYVSFPLTLNSSANWIWIEDAYGVMVYDQTLTGYPSSSGRDGHAWSYDDASSAWDWTPTPTPSDIPNEFPPAVEINYCSGLRLNEVAANVSSEDQFIELHNPTSHSVQLAGCALQTNRSASATFVFDDEWLPSGSQIAVYVKDTELTLTKTTSGTVYLLSSDLKTEIDSVAYEDLAGESSYSLVGETWISSYAFTPNATNVWAQYPECSEGYARNLETGNCNKLVQAQAALDDCGPGKYRSPDTNRCRSLEALATALTPCDTGQYRNPETNRCRSLVSTASVLTPCGPGQERNPETNRCRSVTTDTDLQPCAANQERNPETNRCRNVSSAMIADFPIEAVAQGGQATLGWWAFGGVGLLALGYAGWEWRHEVLAMIRRMASFAKPSR
jgi:hypothetical protein